MPERHTVEFAKVSFNVMSDADRGTITLQFDWGWDPREDIKRILSAIQVRYGTGIRSRLHRWRTGEGNPLILPLRAEPHPDNPDVLCFKIGVKKGERFESALSTLLGFLRRQPGYQRTIGHPLDRDQERSEDWEASTGDTSGAVNNTFRFMLNRRKE